MKSIIFVLLMHAHSGGTSPDDGGDPAFKG